MDLFFLIALTIVACVPGYAHDSRGRQSYNRLANTNTYNINNRLYDNRNVGVTSDCYDLCFDALLGGSRIRTAGCLCSRFDFNGIEFGGRLSQRRYTTDCGCPLGSVCVRTNNRRRCVSARSSGINRSYSMDATGYRSNDAYPMNTGLPRRLGGHCGYLSTVCQASQRDSNQQVRFTYDYMLRRCVRERVHSICNPLGPRNNIFASLRTCNRMCL